MLMSAYMVDSGRFLRRLRDRWWPTLEPIRGFLRERLELLRDE